MGSGSIYGLTKVRMQSAGQALWGRAAPVMAGQCAPWFACGHPMVGTPLWHCLSRQGCALPILGAAPLAGGTQPDGTQLHMRVGQGRRAGHFGGALVSGVTADAALLPSCLRSLLLFPACT